MICLIFDVNILYIKNIAAIDITKIFASYGLIIAIFMAGSHWGQHLNLKSASKWRIYLPIFSNINAILLWISYLILSFKLFLIALIISFMFTLFVDKKLFSHNVISKKYFYTRFVATMIVITAIIISFGFYL